jgi:hypothetical protein
LFKKMGNAVHAVPDDGNFQVAGRQPGFECETIACAAEMLDVDEVMIERNP